ncbi:MAG: D-alanyl-D-alanine carboxypeptidase [Actinomycetes bacterium]
MSRRGVAAVLVTSGAALVVAVALLVPATAVADGAPNARTNPTPVLSARRVPDLLLAPVGRRKVAAVAAPVVAAAPPDSCLLVRDGSLVLVGSRTDQPLAPASNMKVLTAAVALDVLGPSTTFVTEVEGPAPSADGTVDGNLVLVGGGDPLLTTETGTSLWTARSRSPASRTLPTSWWPRASDGSRAGWWGTGRATRGRPPCRAGRAGSWAPGSWARSRR